MFKKEIITIFTIFILTITTKVNALKKGILDKFEYVPKKGYIINDIEDFKLDYEDSVKNLYISKTDDELDKLDLFKTIDIPTPEMWKEDWKVKKDDKLYKKYEKNMRIPDPNNNETVYQLLIMSRNAYVPPDNNDWVDLTEYGWEILHPFGWNSDPNEKTSNRVRGYIFKNEAQKVIVVSIKGTSAGLFGIGGPTADFDKLNDNMMFSCCCAIVDVSWSKICDCYSGISNTCEMSCLKRVSSTYSNSYYGQLMDIYKSDEIQKLREEEYDVFFTGHSLGGALASLSGLSLYAPVFTFEAPGEEQFARRIGLKLSKNDSKNPYGREEYKNIPIYHFGNNGDPIYTGKCKGITSTCYYSGFAMETKCHVGKMYMFDLSKNRNEDPADGTPGNDDPGNEDPGNGDPDNPDYNDPNIRPVEPPKNNNDTPTHSYSNTKESPVFLINKSSIDEHQFHLFMKRANEKGQNTMNSDVDPSLRTPRVPSNPSKLNMLHHRVDYVISLLKKWEGPWPEEDIQDVCTDCDNWEFIEGDGDEGHT